MHFKYLNRIFALLAIIVISSCGAPSFKEIASAKISEFLASHKEMSATYMIASGDDIISQGAMGYFDREAKTPLKLEQKMPIASGTKQMTAAMIMKLQERGLLTTQDTIGKFLGAESGWWPGNMPPAWANQISIHQLLTHTSGLPEYIPALKFDINLGAERIKHLIAEYAATTPLVNQPGEKYAYTNTGYFFLGLIIEKLTNQELALVFKNELFEPLAMSDTHMASFEEALQFQSDQLTDFPKRYFVLPTGAEPQYHPAKVDFFLIPFSDGGVVSTVSDLIKWNRAFHGGKVVSEYSYKLMTTPHNEGHDNLLKNNVQTGYGVYIAELPSGELVYYHSGRAVAIRSEHGFIPSSSVYFAILSNTMAYKPPEIAGKIDYTNIHNQFDISFFRSLIWEIVSDAKRK